ncbi:acyl CoA binding protein-domain-containing protein [Halteromyces radiatus]|uniref:acyl CoA binding protein-domain-containing protein n=1 Tax=Halteromyces radiatus TaxID=101107 RepID=UPI00221EB1A3|nr:acyl CoA binding protein-domain-containing protein [Halteromyces radiatus]KAI8099013.1 acyl CoA binding protein-domain-containing protein [Halteromyces radiatus]
MTSSLPYNIHLRFRQALDVVRSIPVDEVALQPIPTDKLKFYGLYKQATLGECNTPKPSSRKVVEYAKWKAWYRIRHLSSLEAQNLYVNALVELLVEFINRYPNNRYVTFAKEALQALELDPSAGTDDMHDDEQSNELYSDAWESTPSMDEYNPLVHIEPYQLSNNDSPISPIRSYATPSLVASTPSIQASISRSSNTHNSPHTPVLSPQQSYFGHQKWSTPSTMMMMPVNNDSSSDTNKIKHLHNSAPPPPPSSSLSSPPSTSNGSELSYTYSHQIPSHEKDTEQHRKLSERTLENLQTEVTALTEQMDRLRHELQEQSITRRSFHIGWLVQTLIKHLLANCLLVGILFWIMWRRRSPFAIAFVDYLRPQIKTMLRSLAHSTVKKVMFWKLTV